MMEDSTVLSSSIMFAQKRDRADHFALCKVQLHDSFELTVEAVEGGKRKDFDRGLSLDLVTKVVTTRKRKLEIDMTIIRLEVMGHPIMHLILEDENEGDEWKRKLEWMITACQESNRIWELVENVGVGNELLEALKLLDDEMVKAISNKSRATKLLLHAVCEELALRTHVTEEDLQIVDRIIKANVQAATKRDAQGALPLHLLVTTMKGARKGGSALVETVLKGNEEAMDDWYSDSKTGLFGLPIHHACEKLCVDAVQVLLNFESPIRRMNDFLGENIHLREKSNRGDTPLHLVLKSCLAVQLENETLECKDSDDSSSISSETDFVSARELCRLICESDPQCVLARDPSDDNAIHLASGIVDEFLFRILLESPCSCRAVHAANTSGKKPVDILLQKQRQSQLLGSKEGLYNIELCLALVRLDPISRKFLDMTIDEVPQDECKACY